MVCSCCLRLWFNHYSAMFAMKMLNRCFIFSLNWLNVLPNFMWICWNDLQRGLDFYRRKQSLRRLCFHRCLSFHGGVSLSGGSLPRGGALSGEGLCPGGLCPGRRRGACVQGGGLCPGRVGLCPGRGNVTVMCGRYASYWNGFLFSVCLCNLCISDVWHKMTGTTTKLDKSLLSSMWVKYNVFILKS